MTQLRKDPFGPGWVIISPERGIAPSDFGTVKTKAQHSPLSPGNEHLLGQECQALRPPGSSTTSPDWQIRVVEMPAALLSPKNFQLSEQGPFVSATNSGYQELVIEHPDAQMTLERMPKDHLRQLLKIYRDRLAYLGSRAGIKHVQLSRNSGKVAGAQFNHPHATLLALPVQNRWLEEELEAARQYFQEQQRCIFCDVIAAELSHKQRLVSQNRHFVALTPYASKTPFETWIFPRQHSSCFMSLAANAFEDLADLLKSVLYAINSALDHPPYNMVLHTLPNETNDRYHWHIELLPRLTRQAGFDWSTGFYVNPTPPEDAARFLKEALMMQGAVL